MIKENIVTGEKLQNLCELFIGTSNNKNYNPTFRNDRRWIDIHDILNNKQIIDNPKFVYLCSADVEYLCKILEYLKNPFVLLMHNSDQSITEKYSDVFDNEKILKIYTQNLLIHHPKCMVLPIGVANSQWNHGNLDLFCKVINDTEMKKENYIYFYFEINTNTKARQDCYNILSQKGLKWDQKRNFEDYLITMKKHKYTICPVGNGPDCHRFWECLYLDVIPIVVNNPLIQHLKKYFKMVILENWNNFDPNNLVLNEPLYSSLIFFEDYKKLIYKSC